MTGFTRQVMVSEHGASRAGWQALGRPALVVEAAKPLVWSDKANGERDV